MTGLFAWIPGWPWMVRRTVQEPVTSDALDRLTREMHHRVKNNLQIIASIVSLRARDASTPEARWAHAVIGAQVHTLTLVHRWLHETGGGATDEQQNCPGGMIVELCAMLEASLALPDGGRLAISHDIAPIDLLPDQAMPVAFLITELAVRAAQSGASCPVPFHVTANAAADVIGLTLVSSGLAGGAQGAPVPRIINAMVQQLHATLQHDAAMGCWTIRFPASASSASLS